MDERSKNYLEELKLRGLIAFTARSARRVFPVVVLANRAVQECDEAIAMAEAFAAGEPGSLIRARRVAEAVEDNSLQIGGEYPRMPQHNSWYARHAAAEVAKASVSAFSAVTRTPPSKPCCQEAAEHAATACYYAERTTEPFGELGTTESWYSQFERENPVLAREAEWARHAFRRDLEALRQFHRGPVTELGLAVDTSARGPLGPLWLPDQVPGWYQEGLRKWRKPRSVAVETGEEFLHLNRDHDQFPDLICWHLGSVADEVELTKLKESLQMVQQVSRSLHRPPPGLVVYAPGIAEDKRFDLVRLGAIVYADPLGVGFVPHDADSLRAVLRERLKEEYDGWEEDPRGFWLHTGPRVTWRVGSLSPTPLPAERHEPEPAGESEKGEKVTKDDYQKLLEYLWTDEGDRAEY